MTTTTPWALVPSVVRCYINSENPKDIEHARALCAARGIDYDDARRRIVAEAVAESARLAERRAGRT